MSYFKSNTSTPKSHTSTYSQKKELSAFPFGDYCDIPSEGLAKHALDTGLIAHASWLLPQMLAFFGTLKMYKDDKGEYLALPFLEHNFGRDPHLMGMWKVAARMPRSSIVKPQNSGSGPEYSMLVPLILAGIKKYQGINYSEWSQSDLEYVVDRNLAEAMLVPANDIPTLSKDEILAIRTIGLTVATGSRIGQVDPVTSKWALTGIKDTALGHLPKLAVTMITQVWVAHPTLRTKYMVLDPNDWDGVPEPLVALEVVKPQAKMFSNLAAAKWI